MSITKKFLKSKPLCKVTFKLDASVVDNAEKVALVGEFNEWNPSVDQMQKLKDGSFKATLDLETGKEYQFRFLVNNQTWINATEADKFVPAGIGAEKNSVIAL